MDLQLFIVALMVTAAIVYAVVTFLRKRRAFSTKDGCGDDCGCSGGSKKLPS